RSRRSADASAGREGLCEARQDRCGGRGGDLRGGEPSLDALCGAQDARAARATDAAPGADLLLRQRTQTINALRAHMAELGLVAATGRQGLGLLLAILADAKDERLPQD